MPKGINVSKDERQGLMYGSLIAAGVNAAMGNDVREGLYRALQGGSHAYAKGMDALYNQKQEELEAQRRDDLMKLQQDRFGLDQQQFDFQKQQAMQPQAMKPTDMKALIEMQAMQGEREALPQMVADFASTPQGVPFQEMAGSLAQGNPKDVMSLIKEQMKPQKEEKDESGTTKTLESWAEAMYGKKWKELNPNEKRAVMEKQRERQVTPIIVSTPYVDASTGTPLVMDRAGNMKPANVQGGVQPAAKPTAEMVKAESEITNMQSAMDRIEKNYKKGFVGPISGRVGSVKESTIGIPEGQATFYGDVRSLKDALLRAKSGAQINEQEYARMTKFLPDENSPASVFEARMKRFKQELNSVIKGRARGRTGQVSQPSPTGTKSGRFTVTEIP